LSGGYEDDEDLGYESVYTGAGGSDPNTRLQVADQTWTAAGNAGLLKSMDLGLPVRDIRGHTHKSPYSPKTGYTYSGLYNVVDAWEEVGQSGFKICRFMLIYIGTGKIVSNQSEVDISIGQAEVRRVGTSILRLVRDTNVAVEIKKLYHNQCQVCSTAVPTKNGTYSEAAHIKPLDRPHEGADHTSNNILCLCPNHHIMFDRGSFSIADNFTLLGCVAGKLLINRRHTIDIENFQYHRKCHGFN